jgi:hypothetical protein
MKYRLPALLVCLAILSLPCPGGAETIIKFGHSGSTTHATISAR